MAQNESRQANHISIGPHSIFRKAILIQICCCFISLVPSCKPQDTPKTSDPLQSTNRSIEKSISEPVKYSNALEVSNKCLAAFKIGSYGEVYDEFFDETLKARVDKNGFLEEFKKIKRHLGPITDYKQTQSDFLTSQENGVSYLISTKLVQHEKAMVEYRFVFIDNGEYHKLTGFHYRVKK